MDVSGPVATEVSPAEACVPSLKLTTTPTSCGGEHLTQLYLRAAGSGSGTTTLQPEFTSPHSRILDRGLAGRELRGQALHPACPAVRHQGTAQPTATAAHHDMLTASALGLAGTRTLHCAVLGVVPAIPGQ